MFRAETLKWFVVGLVVTSFVLLSVLALTWTPSISAQDVFPNNRDASVAPASVASQAPSTDNPTGELNVPWAAGPEIPNDQVRPAPGALEAAGTAVERAAAPEAVNAGYGSPLVIPAADFSNDGNTPNGFFFSFAGGNLYATGASYACMKAPAYLPQGAHITDVWMSAVDNAPSDIVVDLNRVDNYGGVHVAMATLSTSGASTTIQTPYDASITSPDVSYPDYSYYVTTCLPGTNLVKLYSVRIYYTLH